MKTLKYFIITIAAFVFGQSQLQAQKIDTVSFKVEGVCSMCKERIENASLIKGVKWNEWDMQSRMLTVIYKPKKVTSQKLQQAVADFGHDTESVKATDEAYKKLPMCCEYREGQETH